MLGSISIIIQIYLKFLLFIHACAFAQSKWSEVSKLGLVLKVASNIFLDKTDTHKFI